MGVWGADLFSDDLACDVRDHYRELLEDGVADDVAVQRTVERFRVYLEEPDGLALLAFAVTQSRLGRLNEEFRDRALSILDRGADLETWQRDNPKFVAKRRAVLEKARAQLTGPQPPRKRLRPPKRTSSGLAAGDVLALRLPRRVVLLRVVRVRTHRKGETPVLEEMDYVGTDVPFRDVIETLDGKATDPIAQDPLSGDTRFFAFPMQGIDWQAAGFEKVQSISPRTGDNEAPLPHAGISWSELANTFRRRSGR
jgi:hypothetical protein